jgi:hypothetical protein
MQSTKLGGRIVAIAALALGIVGFAGAQSNYLINVQKGLVPLSGKWEARLTGSFFGADEDLGYFNFNGVYGLGNNWAITLNGAFADRKTKNFASGVAIRTGGSDIEVQALYGLPTVPGLSLAAGVSMPSTPNQDEAFFTARAMYSHHFEQWDGYIGASGVFRNDSTLAAITVGAETKSYNGFSFLGEFNGLISGDNTFDLNGNKRRVSTYGVGVRYQKPGDVDMTSFLLAWTNSLGSTTGFSLTPGLNNSGALFIGVSFSR